VILEFMGGSGKSGSSRYSVMNGLGNLPVVYMSAIDGLAYQHWGPRGMPKADAILAATGASALLIYFLFASRRRRGRTAA
jgi:hypothetical protein